MPSVRLTLRMLALKLLSSLFLSPVINNLAGAFLAGLNSSNLFVINLFSGTVFGWTAIVLDLVQWLTLCDVHEQPIIVLLDELRKTKNQFIVRDHIATIFGATASVIFGWKLNAYAVIKLVAAELSTVLRILKVSQTCSLLNIRIYIL